MPADQCTEELYQQDVYKDEEWLRENYVGTDLTYAEIGEKCDVSESTVCRWVRRFGFGERNSEYDLTALDIPESQPWRDGEILSTLYTDKEMSTTDIATVFDCSTATITTWLEKHGIDRRTTGQAQKASWGTNPGIPFQTNTRGREVWNLQSGCVYVHRLVAIAEYGVEAVAKKHVHHINGNPWDNRPSNIELLTNAEHHSKHKKVDGLDRLRLAELYENGDISSRDLAVAFDTDITAGTVLAVHKEFHEGAA